MRTDSSPSLISISSMLDSSSNSISFLTLRISIVVLFSDVCGLLFQLAQRCLQCKRVTIRTEPADHALCQVGKIRVVPKALPRMNIGQMYFNKGDGGGRQGVAQCHAGVCEGRGIDDNEVDTLATGIVHALYQFRFGIALQAEDVMPCFSGLFVQPGINVGEGCSAIYVWLPISQEIQVGSVNDKYAGHERSLRAR